MLSVYVNAGERRHGRRIYEAIVETARRTNVAGASVFPVDLSFGSRRVLHDQASEYAAADLPVVVEIVDVSPKIDALLAELGPLLEKALVSRKRVRVVHGWPANADEPSGSRSP